MKTLRNHPPPPHTPSALRGKYTKLLASLMLLPLFEALSINIPALELLYWLCFLSVIAAGLIAVNQHTRQYLDELLIILPALVALASLPLVGLAPTHHLNAWIVFRHGAGLLALIGLAWRILRDVIRTRVVVFDQICGGLCVYLLIGFAFALCYSALERIIPGSFIIDRARFGLLDNTEFLHRLRALMSYFSFITLTTLGFGDLTPAFELPRALVAIEAVFGQIYMAVFVARLVSMNLAAGTLAITIPAQQHTPQPPHTPQPTLPMVPPRNLRVDPPGT